MTRTEFYRMEFVLGTREAALYAKTHGVPLAVVQLWLRTWKCA